MAPYTTFPLDGDPLSLRVTIGPGPTPTLTANDIIEMGVKNGVIVAVDSSKRPIRGW